LSIEIQSVVAHSLEKFLIPLGSCDYRWRRQWWYSFNLLFWV